MITKEVSQQFDKLVDQLQEIRELHEQLLITVREKQKGMRSGDVDSMDSCAARERFLIERIKEVDETRRTDSTVLAGLLGLEQDSTLTTIANQLDEPQRSQLLALAGAIRKTAEQVYQINQVNDAVTREILSCFAQMQRQITATHCDLGLYDPNGQKQMSNHVNILDAVG